MILAGLTPIARVGPGPLAAHCARSHDDPLLDRLRLLGALGQAAVGHGDRVDLAIVDDAAHRPMTRHELDDGIVELIHVL